MKKIKILLAVAAGYGNLGDDLLRDTAMKLLTARFPDIEFYHDRPHPDSVLIDMCDLRIIGPGGLLYDSNDSHTAYFKQYMKKPFILFGTGLQDIETTGAKEDGLIQKAFSEADLIIERHSKDLEIIKRFRGNLDNVHVFPDVGYFFKPSYSMKFPKYKTPVITICPQDETLIPEEAYQFLSYVIGLSWLDNDKVEEIGRKINPNKTTVDFYRDSFDLTYNLIAESDLLITDRYHAGVLGILAGTKVITTAETWKLQEFGNLIDWNKLCKDPAGYYQSIETIESVEGYSLDDIWAGKMDILKPVEDYLKANFNYGGEGNVTRR